MCMVIDRLSGECGLAAPQRQLSETGKAEFQRHEPGAVLFGIVFFQWVGVNSRAPPPRDGIAARRAETSGLECASPAAPCPGEPL